MNVCLPSKFTCEILKPNVIKPFERWSGHQCGALMNGINALIEETPESSVALSTM